MKKVLILIAGAMLAFSANAQTKEDIKNGGNNVKLLLGSAQATTVFGLDYERRTGSFGLGGKVLHSTKNSTVGKAESTTIDGHVTSHLYDQNDMDIYVSAGLAVTNMDDAVNPANTTATPSDETLVGPSMAIGALYTLNPQWAVGFEYYSIYNWFSEKVGYKYEFSNAVVSFNF